MKKYLKQINKNGYVVLKNIFNKNQTLNYKKALNLILKKKIKLGEDVGNKGSLILYNYFLKNKKLLNLIFIKKINDILKNILDNDYVLQSTVAINRQNIFINSVKNSKFEKTGTGWHTDSKYLNNKRLAKGFSFIVIIALDPFAKHNAPTRFIKNSMNFRKIPKKTLNIKYQELFMPEGSVCIMDSGMWHSSGGATQKSRWSIFSIYTGWFVKPYFDFSDYLRKTRLNKSQKKMLHGFCIPPKPKEKRLYTLTKTNL